MIRLQDILAESGLTDTMQILGIGQLSCKWDTGADTRASALHAEDIHVHHGQVTWTCQGRTHTAPCIGYSQPRGKHTRPIVELQATWRGHTVHAAFALTDRGAMSTDVLCNLQLMRQLGVHVDLNKGLQ